MRNSILAMVLILFVSPSYGERKYFLAHVDRVLIDSTNFGGCMARLSPSPQAFLPNCKPDWVTFGCDGVLMPKDMAYHLYSAAQLGLVTGIPIEVQVNDAKRHNGYCLAERVDNRGK